MTNETESEVMTYKEFLENTPPGKSIIVSGIKAYFSSTTTMTGFRNVSRRLQDGNYLATPPLKLYCANDECEGDRTFEGIYTLDRQLLSMGTSNHYLTYKCQNCKSSVKIFAIRLILTEAGTDNAEVFKYGEYPQFGPPIPPRALTLIGSDRDLFLTGRRAENQGMGIGAFAYYRRVVENQKDRIFDAVIKVTNKISPDDPIIEELKQAKGEVQFTKAVGEIKHGLPSSLQINGQNPLTLLHSALSEGMHDHDDKECLELAGAIRNVLFEFADKLSQALKEDKELSDSVSKLIKAKKTREKKEQQNEH
ncbi:MAG: hypothetical protein ACYSTS_15610 [Planctomycetota bacterium]|jgi:hypothetical protein